MCECRACAWCGRSSCSFECGDGTQTRVRYAVHPKQQAVYCSTVALNQTAKCFNPPCFGYCGMTEWTPWSACRWARCDNPGGGLVRVACGGRCPRGGAAVAADHVCLVCAIGTWPRSASCGRGTRQRTRSVTTPASSGGLCGATVHVEDCNTAPCDPASCAVSPWTPWSNCSAPCGTGTTSRTRVVIRCDAGAADAMFGSSLGRLCGES